MKAHFWVLLSFIMHSFYPSFALAVKPKSCDSSLYHSLDELDDAEAKEKPKEPGLEKHHNIRISLKPGFNLDHAFEKLQGTGVPLNPHTVDRVNNIILTTLGDARIQDLLGIDVVSKVMLEIFVTVDEEQIEKSPVFAELLKEKGLQVTKITDEGVIEGFLPITSGSDATVKLDAIRKMEGIEDAEADAWGHQ